MAYQKKRFGVYHKWYMDAARVYGKIFNDEQMGRLFFAVMRYMETGKEEEVGEVIRFAYLDQCSKIDVARGDYEAKCAQNARNGAAGGRAAAANRQGCSSEDSPIEGEKKTKPFRMTKTDFMDIFKKLKHDEFVQAAPADVKALHEKLAADGWKWAGVPFTNRDQVERFICLQFAPEVEEYRFRILDVLHGVANDGRFHPFRYRWIDDGADVCDYPADMGSLLDYAIDEDLEFYEWALSFDPNDNSFFFRNRRLRTIPEMVSALIEDELNEKIIIEDSEG